MFLMWGDSAAGVSVPLRPIHCERFCEDSAVKPCLFQSFLLSRTQRVEKSLFLLPINGVKSLPTKLSERSQKDDNLAGSSILIPLFERVPVDEAINRVGDGVASESETRAQMAVSSK
jgi:hypothetical protein